MVEIRKANSHDLPQAAKIYGSALIAADWLPSSYRPSCEFVSATDGEDIFVALSANQIVTGFVSVWTPDSFVHHLYVDVAFRRTGIGTTLLASLADWLPTPWWLKCLTANHRAMAFYESLGWVSVSIGNSPEGEYRLMSYSA